MENHQSCEMCSVKECFLYKHCTSEWHEDLGNSKKCSFYKKNEQIIWEGDKVKGIFFIQKGKVKVFKETNYRGQIIRLAKEGDILGHRGLGGDNTYPISASVLEDSHICYIDQDALFKLMRNNSMLSIKMMLFYAEELRKTETRLRNMAIMTVRERVADALLMIHEVFGLEKEKPFDFSRKEIAEIAGTYAEQVSRYITEFKKEKILKLSGKKIILLNPSKLEQIIAQYN